MKLTIINSTAPGTAASLSPLFEALADAPAVQLSVLEQVPAHAPSRPFLRTAGSLDAPHYRLEQLPTYFYNRRHACAQVLTGRFRRVLAENDPEVIYILGEPGYVSTYQVVKFVRRALPRAKLCLFAAQNVYQRFPPPFPAIERWVLGRIDHAFPIGGDHEAVLRSKGYSGPVTHLPLGVDTDLFSPGQPDVSRLQARLPRPIAGYVGDFLPARDVALLIEAVHACKGRPSLLLVGDGSARENLECLARERDLHGRVAFVGRSPHTEIPNYMRYMDILVLPSRSIENRCFGAFRIANAEQFGRVLIEAMACGTPTVGSSCGEIPRVIGDAGRVYPEGDRAALTAALEELCRDDGLRERLGRAGVARARACYDWRLIARRLLAAMHGLLSPARAGLRSAPLIRA